METSENGTDFILAKWYMDCIDNDGNLFIGYSAVLKWKKFKLNYANILLCDRRGKITSQTTIKKLAPPIFSDDSFFWFPVRLKVKGNWTGLQPPIKKTMLNSASGSIHWTCCLPKANGKISLPGKKNIIGLGYTEKLEMTVKPWQLPFNHLKWGRFLSSDYSIIWVNWSGESGLNLLYYNGRQIKDGVITDDVIDINNRDLLITFSNKVVLREGTLVSTALSNIPGLKSIFPKNILNTYEKKWRSIGILKKGNKIIAKGWVIHEVVRWL